MLMFIKYKRKKYHLIFTTLVHYVLFQTYLIHLYGICVTTNQISSDIYIYYLTTFSNIINI